MRDEADAVSATDCATQMVDEKVVAVLVGVSGQSGSIYKGLEGSGILFFGAANIDQSVLTQPGAVVMANGLAAIAGPALVAQGEGLTKAAVVVSDVPAATGPVNAVGKIFYQNAGVELTVVPVAPSVADPTPQIQAAISGGAQQFSIIGNSTLCTSAIKAMKTLGFDGPIVVIRSASTRARVPSIPDGYTDVTILTSTTDDPADEDVQTYRP
jgi:branched-chain amino acid transport system substrate-binding protein